MKKIRNAVRVLSFKDDKVLCIKYKEHNKGYYDIPGGKIEEGETEFEACKRELREETGLEAENFSYIGTMNIIYPSKKFVMKFYETIDVRGEPKEFEENSSCYITIKDLVSYSKIFPTIYILNDNFIELLKTKNFNITIECDEEHKIINVIK